VYASRTGADRAARYNSEVGQFAILSVFSEQPLDLPETLGVHVQVAHSGTDHDTYRYDCLNLLARLGDTLLVVPSHYTTEPSRQVIYTLDARAVRLAFAAPAAAPTTCSVPASP
jgi:hypothetical protein